jgi:ribosomal protein S18 acetylase RimI-like enzyme
MHLGRTAIPMEIRRPVPEDAREMRDAWARAWRAGHEAVLSAAALEAVDFEPTDEDLQRWRERIETRRDRHLVADDDGRVVGYAAVRWAETKPFVGEDEAGLKELYVRPDRWGEGVGGELLERAIGTLPDGTEAVLLETLDGNDRAAGFYEARGFRQVGERPVEVAGETYPALVYGRPLG